MGSIREQDASGGEAKQPAPAATAEKVDTAKVRIKRVAGKEPITGFSYIPFRTPEMEAMPHSQGTADFHPDPAKDVFEVSADIAAAAVATGGFEVDPSSRVKLSGQTGAVTQVNDESAKGGE